MGQATARIPDAAPADFLPESELIASDGEPLETPWHRHQMNLMLAVVRQAMAERGEESYYAGGDMFVYYSLEQAREVKAAAEQQLWLFNLPEGGEPEVRTVAKKHFRGPDVFVVRGGVAARRRRVWASWLEDDRLPDVILELQSESTAEIDTREKRELYSQVFRTPEYFYYGPDEPDLGRYRDELVGLRLAESGSYEEIEPDSRGWIWSEVLEHYIGRWDGTYEGYEARWLRLYDSGGRLIPTAEEFERQQKEHERQQKEHERQQKELLREQKEAERRRADAAEAEVARLRRVLEQRPPTTTSTD